MDPKCLWVLNAQLGPVYPVSRSPPPWPWHHQKVRLHPEPCTYHRPPCLLHVTSQPAPLGTTPTNLNCAYSSQAKFRFSLCHKTFVDSLAHTPFPFQAIHISL